MLHHLLYCHNWTQDEGVQGFMSEVLEIERGKGRLSLSTSSMQDWSYCVVLLEGYRRPHTSNIMCLDSGGNRTTTTSWTGSSSYHLSQSEGNGVLDTSSFTRPS